MAREDADVELRRLAEDSGFLHHDTAMRALRYRKKGDVDDLVAVHDDPHPCGMIEVLFALAGEERPWLNWVPMPGETSAMLANEFGGRLARGERVEMHKATLSAPEPPSAMTACRRIVGPLRFRVLRFPPPDIRVPLRRGKYTIWRFDGINPVPNVPAPSEEAIRVLHEVAGEAWLSPLAGYLKAGPLGELPLTDLLGLLVHLPGAPDTPRWRHLAGVKPAYWYRLLQPWVCLGILRHAEHEEWATSTRREVLVDLAFGVEDWVADAALFALVAAAYRMPDTRDEVRELVRARLDVAAAAERLVTIEESLARLMLITPGCTRRDRARAKSALARAAGSRRDRWRRRLRIA